MALTRQVAVNVLVLRLQIQFKIHGKCRQATLDMKASETQITLEV